MKELEEVNIGKKDLVVDDEKPIADILQFNLKKRVMMLHVPMMEMKHWKWLKKSNLI